MRCVRVVNVRGMNKPQDRATVVYCGRAWAGWPASPWCNPYPSSRHANALDKYQQALLARSDFGEHLRQLWEATDRGVKPLGCWCVDATAGDGQPVVCHAQILAALLQERFGREAGS